MNIAYVVAPFVGWLLAGSLKFVINSVRARRLAFDLIGYGGMPSTHTAIVSTPAFLISLREGWDTPAFSVAAALVLVVAIDAMSLRRQVGHHASAINLLVKNNSPPILIPLRERVGHGKAEVLGGILVGILAGFGLNQLL